MLWVSFISLALILHVRPIRSSLNLGFTRVVGHKGPVKYAPFSWDGLDCRTWHPAKGRAPLPPCHLERFSLIVETVSLRLL